MREVALLVLASICMLVWSPSASAEVAMPTGHIPGGGLFTTGQELSALCDGKLGNEQPDTFGGGTCLGFINGAAEVLLLYRVICYNHVTKGELSDTVVKFMNDHPGEIQKHTAIVLAGIALKAKYPVTESCQAQTK